MKERENYLIFAGNRSITRSECYSVSVDMKSLLIQNNMCKQKNIDVIRSVLRFLLKQQTLPVHKSFAIQRTETKS